MQQLKYLNMCSLLCSWLFFVTLVYLVTSQLSQKTGQLNKAQTKNNMDGQVDYARKFRDLESKTKEILQLQNQVLKSFATQHKEMMVNQEECKQNISQLRESVKILQREVQNKAIFPAVVEKTSRCQNVPEALQSGMRTVGGKRYFFSYEQPEMSWVESQIFCNLHGMELVSIETKEEWESLRPEYETLKDELVGHTWSSGKIGFTDMQLKWSSSNTNINFVPGAVAIILNSCLGVSSTGWQSLPCSNKLHFVCEKIC